MDRVGEFLREKTPRRALTIATFVGLLLAFRHAALLLVCFVAFERLLGAGASLLQKRLKWSRKKGVLACLGLMLVSVGVAVAVGIGHAVRAVAAARASIPERLAEIEGSELYTRLHEYLRDTDRYMEAAKHYSSEALHYLAAVGHGVLYALIGLILGVIFHLEHEELGEFHRSLEPTSVQATVARWLGHVADAISVTIQLQLIVALFNAVFTLPVLIALGLPHVPLLALMIFVTSLVPVIGNFVSGIVLTLLAYQAKGWMGVGVFSILTFALHKVESYYLNPRLTARHVKLPGFVLIVSLIAWEHLLGFAGLFVSFPFLFVAARIRAELREDDERSAKTTSEA